MNTPTVWTRLRCYPTLVKLALAGYVLAFAFGACVHATVLLGWWGSPPHPVNPWLAYGYDSLVFFDPLVIALLLRFPRAGLLLAVAIMLADVGVNTFAAYMSTHVPVDRYAADYGARANSAFLGFVLGTAPFLWPYLGRRDAR
jgi:hypothetical protein